MTGFGLYHLPYGVFSRSGEEPRVGVRFEDSVVEVAREPTLNPLMARGRAAWAETRGRVRETLERGDAELVPLADVRLHRPFEVADYVDFYSSLEHSTNLGKMFRPGSEPLLPNWRWLPVAYHGRAGTIVVGGTDVLRPHGQAKAAEADSPTYGPSRRLDIELELGFVIGTPSRLGRPVRAEEALDHVFGIALVNDWSARDIQAWEYQPLGPFLGKSFATSISPWITPWEAVERYRVPAPPQEPAPLDYLRVEPWALDLDLEVQLNGQVISRSSARHLYWNVQQQIAHATVNGASLRTGDLLASGTISGPTRDSCGSLIELSWNGQEPLQLEGGSSRTFLEDDDEVVLRGRTPDGKIELGEVRGTVRGSAE